jgi:predicted dehydrogenase
MTESVGVGVLGAGGWSLAAHLPAFAANGRARLVAICDVDPERTRAAAASFDIPRVYDDPAALVSDPDVELVDVCTTTETHEAMVRLAIEAGKHVLSEKPVTSHAESTFRLAELASRVGVHHKVMYTFRYAPAIRGLTDMIDGGTLGSVFHVHGFEQNPQFLDPETTLRQVPHEVPNGRLRPSSLIEYGSHLLNMMRACGGEIASVASSMANFVPERRLRGVDGITPAAIEDATVGIVRFAGGAHGMLQTSHVSIGPNPGVELRVFGSRAAAIARVAVVGGRSESLHLATPDRPDWAPVDLHTVEFPRADAPAARPSQRYVANLIDRLLEEIFDAAEPECDFFDAAKTQRVLDALVAAHDESRWVEVASARERRSSRASQHDTPYECSDQST